MDSKGKFLFWLTISKSQFKAALEHDECNFVIRDFSEVLQYLNIIVIL